MYDTEVYRDLLKLNETQLKHSYLNAVDMPVAIFFCVLMVFNILFGTCLNSCFLFTVVMNKKLRVQRYNLIFLYLFHLS